MGTNDESGRRPYRSTARQAAAQRTRRRIVSAATELFVADGYAATAMRAVATLAGVAEKTIYLQFANKTDLLKAVVETAIVGDDVAVPVAGRVWFREAIAETDLDRKLRKLVAGSSALHERTGPVFAVAKGAAAVDPEAAELWAQGKQGHRADTARLAESFVAAGLVPEGVPIEWLSQLLYILLGPESWQLARNELGLDAGGYEEWLLTSLTRSLQTRG